VSGNSRLDWAAAREHLAHVQQAIEETALHSRERRDRIYRMRAELLARPVSRREDSAGETIMIVRIGAARYGVALPQVSEAIGGATCAPIPGAPPEVAGLIQIRGEVRPVLDVGRILGLPQLGLPQLGVPENDGGNSKIILLLRRGSREIGIQVDEVEDIRTVSEDERKPPFHGAVHARWMTDDLVTVLDTNSLLEEHTEVS
jgi:purine-binding chemotaxis protein CheW